MSPPVAFGKYLPGEITQFENFLQRCKVTQADGRALLKDPEFQMWIADWIARRRAPVSQMSQDFLPVVQQEAYLQPESE